MFNMLRTWQSSDETKSLGPMFNSSLDLGAYFFANKVSIYIYGVSNINNRLCCFMGCYICS
jgi:hypothetical protein